MIGATATGFLTALSLILAIGAQNAFVLRQGLTGSHVFAVCFFCAMSDAVLIAAGVAGFGYVVSIWPAFPDVMALAGATFLVIYGVTRLLAAWRGGYGMELAGRGLALGPAMATVAALTWLNPHVYLDTLGLIGAVSTQYAGTARLAFGAGAVCASFTFFFSLGYGARFLAPVMTTARTWQVLDVAIGALMFAIAAGLVWSVAGG
ncbi:MAG: LysE/ArgO family amino acid transporter [Pseudomonadota bacterium]